MKDQTTLYNKIAAKAFAVYPGCLNAIKSVVLPIPYETGKKETEYIVAQHVVSMRNWTKVRKGFPKLQSNYNSYSHPEKADRLVIINFQTSLSAN